MQRTLGVALAVSIAGAATAAVNPIAPFVGGMREPLNFTNTRISADQPIFGGAAHLVSHDGNTYIHLLLGDTFNGVNVSPRTGSYILGWTEGPGIFLFNPPVTQFGAYWANNSGTNGATASFFAADNSLLGTQPATDPSGGTWTWNGWQSTTPISRIVVSSTGVLNGFIWFDDLEATVPAPASVALPALSFAWLNRRRRAGLSPSGSGAGPAPAPGSIPGTLARKPR